MARLDALLVARGLARSRVTAKEMIRGGSVTVNGRTITKAAFDAAESDVIECSASELYVGRGALKLERAYNEFGLDFDGKKCIDIGASTGGFTDFMLRNGAAKVFAVDVGHGQLAEKLRNDSRVVNLEGTDIRNVAPEDFGGCADFISVDVSFISLTMILPKVYELLGDGCCAAVLIKPQFEAGRSNIGKRGIVRDRRVHERVLRDIDSFASGVGFTAEQYTYSSIKGGSGNIEYLVKLVKSGENTGEHDFRGLVNEAFDALKES